MGIERELAQFAARSQAIAAEQADEEVARLGRDDEPGGGRLLGNDLAKRGALVAIAGERRARPRALDEADEGVRLLPVARPRR